MVTDVERDYLWSTYANDPRARINVGIRRRLAPLMDNDRRKIELMNSLLLSFPGTPIIYYGDEIGMGDNIYLGDRNGVRTPMQWTPDRNGGFSRADPARLYAPTIMDPVYGYEAVNVEAQSRSLSSLLSCDQAADRGPQIDAGLRPRHHDVHPPGQPLGAVPMCASIGDEVILCVANLSRSAQATELDLSAWKDRMPLEMLGRTRFPPIGELPYMITLAPYGFYWFELQERDKSEHVVPRGRARIRNAGGAAGRDLGVAGARRAACSSATCCRAIWRARRWYPERSAKAIQPTLTSAIPFCDIGDNRPWLALFRDDAARRHDALRAADADRMGALRPRALQSARAGRRAAGRARRHAARRRHRPDLHRAVAAQSAAIADGRRERTGLAARIPADQHASPTSRSGSPSTSAPSRPSSPTAPRWSTTTMSSRSIASCEPGINPEIEMGRFLTEVAGFANTPALLGSVELVEGDEKSAIGVVHAFVANQGDAWTVTRGLSRSLRRGAAPAGGERPPRRERGAGPLSALHVAGRAARRRDACCARRQQRASRIRAGADRPRRRAALDRRYHAPRRARLRCAPAAARHAEGSRPPAGRPGAGAAAGAAGLPRTRCCRARSTVVNIRHHGDLHLGQMLIVKDDIFIIDFEGAPRRRSPNAGARRPRRATSPAWSARSIIRQPQPLSARSKWPTMSTASSARRLAEWRDRATAAFLAAYREAMTDQRLWPADPNGRRRLADLLPAREGASTKSNTNCRIRPEWLRVPLTGIIRMLSQPSFEAS